MEEETSGAMEHSLPRFLSKSANVCYIITSSRTVLVAVTVGLSLKRDSLKDHYFCDISRSCYRLDANEIDAMTRGPMTER
jgi:hypothetical protein